MQPLSSIYPRYTGMQVLIPVMFNFTYVYKVLPIPDKNAFYIESTKT